MATYLPFNSSIDALAAGLRQRGISPTAQRLSIARILFRRPAHFSAEQIYNALKLAQPAVSKATVYNTLGLFVQRGLIREVLVDPSKVYYDSNTRAHHHMYDVDSGELSDIDATDIMVQGLPNLPADLSVEGVDVVVRVRKA